MPIQIMSLEHALFPTDDLEKMREFYGRVLGLRAISPFDTGYAYDEASFQCLDNQIHIVKRDPNLNTNMTSHPEVSFNPSMQPHIAFRVQDIAQSREALDRAGCCYYVVKGEGVIDRSQVFVRDPAGFVVELFEVLSPAGT